MLVEQRSGTFLSPPTRGQVFETTAVGSSPINTTLARWCTKLKSLGGATKACKSAARFLQQKKVDMYVTLEPPNSLCVAARTCPEHAQLRGIAVRSHGVRSGCISYSLFIDIVVCHLSQMVRLLSPRLHFCRES